MNIFDRSNNFEWRDYFRILYRRKWYFLVTFCLILGGGGYWIAIQKPEFESSCIIEIKQTKYIGNLQSVLPGMTEYQRYASLKSQIINSTSLDELIDSLQLIKDPKMIKAAKILQGSVPDQSLEDLVRYLWRNKLEKAIKVTTFQENVKIRVASDSPEQAYLIVSTITDIFMKTFLDREMKNVQNAQTFTQEQLKTFKAKLEEAEQKLNAYRRTIRMKQQGIDVLDENALNRIKEAIVAIDLMMKSKNDHLNYVNVKLRGQKSIDEFPKTPAILKMLTDIDSKMEQMAFLLTRYSWSSSEVVKINRTINDIRDEILTEIDKYYRTNEPNLDISTLNLLLDKSISLVDIDLGNRKKQVLNDVLQSSANNALSGQAQEMTLKKLEQEVEISQRIYDLFLEQKQGNQIEEAIQRANASSRFNVIEPPRKPIEATGSGRRILAAMTLIAALAISLAMVYMRELVDLTVRTVSEVENTFEIPVLGVVPTLKISRIFPNGNHSKGLRLHIFRKKSEKSHPERNEAKRTKKIKKNPSKIVLPDDQTMSEIERLAIKLIWLGSSKGRQSILVTSSVGGEGKSTISALLAQSLVKNINKNTLLIDFDLRRPKQHHLFKIDRAPGLSDVLSSEIQVSQCIQETSIANLKLIPGGTLLRDPGAVLKTEKVENFMLEIVDYSENIIIDAPPVLPVSDPLILARLVDHIIIVIKAGSTSKNMVSRTINMFEDLNVKVSGIILNNLNNVLPYYYNHRYYGYSYDQKKS